MSNKRGVYGVYIPIAILIISLPFSSALSFGIGNITLNPFAAGVIVFSLLIIFLNLNVAITTRELLIFCWCLLYLATTALSENLISSGYLAFHAIFIPTLSYLVIKYWTNNAAKISMFVNTFIGGAMIISPLFLYEYWANQKRVEILSLEPISSATIFISATVLTIFGSKLSVITKITFSICLIMALLTTFSRMYIFLLLISPVIYFFVKKGFGSFAIISTFTLTLIGTLYLSENANLFRPPENLNMGSWSPIERVTNENAWKLSLYGRALDLKEGIEIFKQNPVTGTGVQKGEFVTRHNFHVEWLEYGGLLGYVLAFLIVYLHYKRYGRIAKENSLVATNLVIIYFIIVNGLFNGLMHGFMPIVMFLFMGLNEALDSSIVEKRASRLIQKSG